MTVGTPFTKTTMNGGEDELCAPSSSGVGVGVGSSPGCIGGPAEASENSAQASASDASSFFIVSPPEVVVSKGRRVPAGTRHSTTEDPADLALYRSLVSANNLRGAAELCRERRGNSPEGRPAARWSKDLGLIYFLAGNYEPALDLLAARYETARGVGGAFLGRYECSLAQVLQSLHRFDEAFEHYTASHYIHEQTGGLIACAQIDTNTGRCYTAAGRPENSHTYFNRALEVARAAADSHLEGEILESAALALEMEGKTEEAEECAHKSVTLISATGDRTALDESVRTWLRLKEKLSEGVR